MPTADLSCYSTYALNYSIAATSFLPLTVAVISASFRTTTVLSACPSQSIPLCMYGCDSVKQCIHLHFRRTSHIVRSLQTIASFNHRKQSGRIQSRVGSFPQSEHLPACHSIRPLLKQHKNLSQTKIPIVLLISIFNAQLNQMHCFVIFTTSLFSEKRPSSRLSGGIHLNGTFTVLLDSLTQPVLYMSSARPKSPTFTSPFPSSLQIIMFAHVHGHSIIVVF